MGYAIAQECAERGAFVTLVSGPTNLEVSSPLINKIDVLTAAEMYRNTVTSYENGTDVVIFSAAVADFTPVNTTDKKIKRGKDNYFLELKPTRDIAAELGNKKKESTIHIGFALETDNELANANDKLCRKNLDAIVLNSLKDEGACFGTDTNKVSIIGRDGSKYDFNLKSKRQVASDIVDYIEKLLSC
ncbi:Coenzyme A biosynthesis bifunctional protein CoaBC [bioreactor metagenome]|uniref:Coenzyme A biosynthesis bifunctional protein CoaBC n=1 Tax=bioreactor metagenome TaxID=1076179 RepID=A0A645CE99_9ZZZZ